MVDHVLVIFEVNNIAKQILGRFFILFVFYFLPVFLALEAVLAAFILLRVSFQWMRIQKRVFRIWNSELSLKIYIIMSDSGSGSVSLNRALDWDDYFMANAKLAAKKLEGEREDVQRSGACIVNEKNIIVGIGRSDVCHAIITAIFNANSRDFQGCKMYVTDYPCNKCAQFIVQSGIKEVIFYINSEPRGNMYIGAKKILVEAEIQPRQFAKQKSLTINI